MKPASQNWRRNSQKKKCPFALGKIPADQIHYLNIPFLQKYLTETGKIVPSRITGVSNKYQHALARVVKYSRYLALLPYCDHH